jgi:hypothetical protein
MSTVCCQSAVIPAPSLYAYWLTIAMNEPVTGSREMAL